MQIKTVIFDLDGTLLNTLGDLADAVNAAIVPRGYAPASEEQVRQRVGNGIRNLIKLSLSEGTPDAEIDACLADFRVYYEGHMMHRTHPYDGVCEVLAALRENGTQVAVLSNKYDPAAKALIAHYFPDLVALTLGERANVPRKPDPTSALEVLATLNADKAQTVYIGDSAVDMNTAKNAGLTAVGVTWGFRSREVLEESGADILVDAPSELIPLLTNSLIDLDALEQAFTGRGFGFSFFDTGAEAAAYLAQACAGKRVGFGGSKTLEQIGAYEAIRQTAEVHWHWKNEAPCMDAEIYLTSANGLSESGEIVNIDGVCNRVAASLYGCESCFVVCGANKLAPDLAAAVERARNIAAPLNARRLNKKTPCAVDGRCHDCRSPERLCRAMTITMAPPAKINRYEIVLIGEDYGF